MRHNLLEFLFGPVAARRSSQSLGEDVIRLFEEAADKETEEMVADKKPLAAALKSIGISNEVIEGPQWCEIHCDNESEYKEHIALLYNPDNMHKLAQLGWVAAQCGDQAMSNEAPDLKIGFIELTMLEQNPENNKKGESETTILKNAQKFASTKMDRDDDKLNPVENDDKSSDDGQKGVGKPADGKQPDGKIKESDQRQAICPKCKSEVDMPDRDPKVPMRCGQCGYEGRAKIVGYPAYKGTSYPPIESLSAKKLANELLEITSCSAIPAVDKPMGIASPPDVPKRIPTRSRFTRKPLRKANEQGRPNR